jgi:hypothetical protein
MSKANERNSRLATFHQLERVYAWAFERARKAISAQGQLRTEIALGATKGGTVVDAGVVNLLADEEREEVQRSVLAAVVMLDRVDAAVWMAMSTQNVDAAGDVGAFGHRVVVMTLATKRWVAKINCGRVIDGELMRERELNADDLQGWA